LSTFSHRVLIIATSDVWRYDYRMTRSALFAPWRMDYIRSLHKPGDEICFLCQASAASDPGQKLDRLVVWQTELTQVVLNRYPYTNGHLLVAPRAHKAAIDLLDRDEKLDLVEQTDKAVQLLKRAVSAQGFNIGINLGRCAGAGVPGHLHQHVVPRWAGDVNFMSVVGDVQIVPETLQKLYGELLAVLKKLDDPS
jgi:ATP adenylyltransferase